MIKVIQISESMIDGIWRLTVLCDDGTIWSIIDREGKWFKMEPVPQDDEKEIGE